jgi:hypothetical protein
MCSLVAAMSIASVSFPNYRLSFSGKTINTTSPGDRQTSHSPCSLSFLLQIALWKSGSEWFLCARFVQCGFFPSSFLLLLLRLLTKGRGQVPMIHRYKEFDPIMTSYLKELRNFVANRRYVSGTEFAFYPIHQLWQHSIIFTKYEPVPQLLGETFTAYEFRHNPNHFSAMEN